MTVRGLGHPANRPVPVWVIREVLPCMSTGECDTVAPKTSPIAWWPKHTPSTGSPASAQWAMTCGQTPASAGAPGPGEMSTPS